MDRKGLVDQRGRKGREGLKVFLDWLAHLVCKDLMEILFSVRMNLPR